MMSKEMRPKVIYIMGFGHSGSTLLDIILGNHPQIEGVGELNKLYRFGWSVNTDRRCSCGAARHNCAYWSKVYGRWSEIVGHGDVQTYVRLQDRFERSKPAQNLRWVWKERGDSSAAFQDYATMTGALYTAIQEFSGKPIIVDSSKIPLRAYGLLLGQHVDLYLLHLIRDGRGVAWSLMKSKPREKNPAAGRAKEYSPTPSWRTTINWIRVNLLSQWVVKQADPNQVFRIQYEQFVHEPALYMNKIGTFIGEDMSVLGDCLASKQPMTVSHVVAGNGLRMKSNVILREDAQWQRNLPARDRRIFWSLGGWLAKKYGYEASLPTSTQA